VADDVQTNSTTWRWRRGIRPRVVVAYVVLVATGLLVANLVVRQVLLGRLDRTVEAALTQEVEELRQLADGVDPATGEPFAGDVAAIFDTFLRRNVPADGEAFYTVVDGEGYLTSFEPPDRRLLNHPEVAAVVADATTATRLDVGTDAGPARVLVVPLEQDQGDSADPEPRGVFVVALFTADERAEIDQALAVVGIVSLVVVLASSVAAWSLAGRVLRPVARLTDTATRITETDLSARIPVEGQDELARLTGTFNSMLDRLEHAATSQRQFLNDIAHDLRTPLTIVQGHLEMLSDDPEERADTLALVADELDRMGRYVSDLLVLAKAEQPDFLHLGLVDVGEWVQDLHAKASGLGEASIVLGEVPPPGVLVAEADGDRLTQAALNVIVNAVQQTAADDEIRISASARLGDLVVSIADTGPGIGPELVTSLFERTTRGDSSRRSRREGTGLGLAIVRAITEAHGGSVSVDTEPGRGSTFHLTIPLDPSGHLEPEELPCPAS
jgi:two-component system, OmpR family, sensor kinase